VNDRAGVTLEMAVQIVCDAPHRLGSHENAAVLENVVISVDLSVVPKSDFVIALLQSGQQLSEMLGCASQA
jgi:hypothetical protein